MPRQPMKSRLRGRRSGAVVVELMIALPILVIALFAIIEFGLWMSGKQRLEMAARIAAEAASKSASIERLSSLDGTEIKTKIYRYLENGGIPTENVQVALMHNVGNESIVVDPPDGTLIGMDLSEPPQVDCEYVRVVVSIPTNDITPNLLELFLLDVSGLTTTHSKTYRYELGLTPCDNDD